MVEFVDFAVSAALERPADTNDTGSVARGAINYTWFFRDLGKSLVKFIAVLARQILRLSLSTILSVAEQLGIDHPVFIPPYEPTVSGA